MLYLLHIAEALGPSAFSSGDTTASYMLSFELKVGIGIVGVAEAQVVLASAGDGVTSIDTPSDTLLVWISAAEANKANGLDSIRAS
jgi:hypothetical protein